MTVSAVPPRRLLRLCLAALLLLLGVTLLAPMLAYPFGSDHGSFATTADVLRRGGVLYRDVWEIKLPGIYYLFAGAFAIFGRSMFAVRLLDLLWTLAAAAVLVLVGSRLLSRGAALAGAFAFLLFYALNFDYWHTAQCDGFASLPLALAALLTLHAEARRSSRHAFAAGLLIGLASLLKFTLATVLALPLLALLASRGEPARPRFARALCYLAGGVLPLVVTALLLWRAGTLDDMLRIVFTWTSAYGRLRVGGAPWQVLRLLFGGSYPILKLIGALSLAGVVSLVLARRTRPLWWFLPTWALVIIVGIAAQGKYFAYHWLPLLPPVGLLAGAGLVFLLERLRRSFADTGGKLISVACLAGLVVLLLAGYWAHFSRPLRYLLGDLPRDVYLADFTASGRYFSFQADAAVAAYLQAHTQPTDTLFVWGLEPLVYFLADRPPATRFIHNALLLAFWSPPAWRDLAVSDLQRSRPKFILIVHNDYQPWANGWDADSATYLPNYPALTNLLQHDYHPLGRLEDFDLWQRQ